MNTFDPTGRDWMQFWSTAMSDWQRAYSWAYEGFAERAQQMGAMSGPGYNPDEMMRIWTSMTDAWRAAMGGMPMAPGMGSGDSSQQIRGCATQAYYASMSNLMRWWTRSAQSWADYARSTAALSAGAALDGRALAVLADETRAQLRRLADISLEESALLQRQLEQLAEQVRAAVDGMAQDAQPRRYARAKD